ncbi:bifunctional 4-hydroxy-2-oxoglutarate aldolase/2-dehydro-3-deoxy-phosphogluconate aldolase [Marinicauda algicola]|uniref:2-dehydro-3-deoxy-phosphogluconate aldolase n=1 Tax=Marinicauda algicola TaxID=2029849 RepID=A0A4S2H1R2_9PROT|nr:bifunctional 4-hydroxy-2-oxoglutarate aldolase/2-dehydro-3-deoxy-phosphogluconate aldolase [Marinicauda algicola]TGY89353.1 bifunctional 4-hydroxy-2-oxoglutarate aldolase/2-dehydro-3-deoxy-phosphogluconate aldolase [Marinicauda algicola]
MTLEEILNLATVIPVLTVEDDARAGDLARALHAGGLKVVELTLRTPAALKAMHAMQDAAPDLVVGMGTIRTPDQARRATEEGAHFLVSPGLTPGLGEALAKTGIPALPGVATASEAMAAREQGFCALKFFPAEPAGGIAYLKALHGPLPDLVFCPTGGIGRETAPAYFALPNVACVGGSWIATGAMIEAGDWDAVTANARAAAQLK